MSTLQVLNIIAPNSNTGTTNIVLGANGDVTFANTFSFSPNGQFVYSNTSTPMTVGVLTVTGNTTANALFVTGNTTANSITITGLANISTLSTTGTSTFNNLVNFAGNANTLSINLRNIAETVTIVASAATGTINFDLVTQSILFYTANSTGNTTINFRGNANNSLNTLLSTGQAITGVFLNTNGVTPFYNNVLQVDGSTITPRWINGSAPTAGNANSIDSYTYTIIKTGAAQFTVIGNLSRYA